MGSRRSEHSTAFDEILLELHNLVSSLEDDCSKTNIRGLRSDRRRSRLSDVKQQDPTETKRDVTQESRTHLRNYEVESRTQHNQINGILPAQTIQSSAEETDEELQEITRSHKQHGICNVTQCTSIDSESNHGCQQVEVEYINDTGEPLGDDCEYIIVTLSASEPTSHDSEFATVNDDNPPYQADSNANTTIEYKFGDQVVDIKQGPEIDFSTTKRQDLSLRRGSPVIGCKTASDSVAADGISKRKSATLDGKVRIGTLEEYGDNKSPTSEEPHTWKNLSLKRVFSKKLSPFRRKPKLKSAKSLPNTTNNSVSRKGDKFKLKRTFAVKDTDTKYSPERSSRSSSVGYFSFVSAESSSACSEYSQQIPGDPQRKRKSGKLFSKSQRSILPREYISQDSEIEYSSGISQGLVSDSSVEDPNCTSYDPVVMRNKKAGASVTAGSGSVNLPGGSPIIRRSTIGASYSRETGSSSPNIYRTTGGENAQKAVPQNVFRHSLHVMKEQSVVTPVDCNRNRWSNSEEGLLKGHTITSQLMALENDKNNKSGSFKSRFQKSMKSGGKAATMSDADKKKLTERTWDLLEPFVWGNLNGQRVEISEVDLLSLSESECIALQKVAEQRLRDIDLGVSITVPKDESKHLHGKNNISVLRRAGVHLSGTKNKSKKEPDHVFAIPLVRVVENDQLLRLQTVEQNDDAFLAGNGTGNDNDSSGRSSSDSSPKTSRRISSSLDSYADQNSSGSIPSANESGEPKVSSPTTPPNGSPVTRKKLPGGRKTLGRRCAVGLNTDTEIDAVQSKLLESLMISETSTKDKKRSLLPPTMPQVPYVVQKCCAHILKHGLDVTGIFRIAGSKKRVKQLRQEFDHGVDVKIDEDYHAHDVAALLKEFFRDLPEALLTRELYQAFISTAKLPQPQRLDALRSLVWLLPMPNRDTLQQLLSFLATVAEFSEDRLDATGKTVTGNKMGVANLSVIFGPNILHRYKKNPSASDQQFQVQSLERAEESTYVIKIVDDMIRSQKDLFVIPRETHDEILRTLQESDPDAVDFLLRRKAANYAKSPSPKFPSDNLDTPSDETAKSFPAPPLSDMNNNNKNGNNSSTALAARYRPQTDSRYAGPGASNFTLSPPQRAPSNSSSSKTNHSVTFTEDDMKEILKPEPTTANPEKSLLSTQASAQSCAQSKTSSPRPQGLAVSQEAGSPKSPTKTGIRHRTKAPSPIALRSATGSSTGLEDCSSASNESLSTARPPTPKQRKNIRVRMVSNPDLEVCSDSETPVRRSQGRGSPRFPLHTLKLSRPAPPAEPHSENVVEISDLTPKTYGRGRRVSKDDLYLSQQLRRRLQRQQSVVI